LRATHRRAGALCRNFIPLNENDLRIRTSCSDTKTDNADASAEIDDGPPLPGRNRRGKKDGFQASPVVAASRLDRLDPAAEESVDRDVAKFAFRRRHGRCGHLSILNWLRNLRPDTGFFQEPTGSSGLLCGNKNAPRQDAKRPFDNAHILVDDEVFDSGVAEQRFNKRDQNDIVGSQ
jgi:hypothetical protein